MTSRAVLLPLFFLSGAAALIFEVAAMKAFAGVLGSSVYASTTTIAAYMAGLALGARLLGRRADLHPDPLRLYGQLELAVAATGLLVPLAAASLGDGLLAQLLGSGGVLAGSPGLFLASRGLVAFLALLGPTVLMGGTLPVLVRALLERSGRVELSVASLYALNALGASLGALVAGFLLMPYGGVRQSLGTALAIYALVGVVALRLRARELEREAARAEAGNSPPAPPVRPAPPPGPGDQLSPATASLLLATTGFVLLGLEHVWFRYFALVLDSSTYSFSVILSGVIAGLGLGSLVAHRRYRTRPVCTRDLEVVLGVYVLALLALLPLYDDLPYAFAWARLALGADFAAITGLKFLLGLAIMLVPAACSGFLFPATLALVITDEGEAGERIGLVTASNTVGGLLGIVASTFLVVPLVGLRQSVELAAVALAALVPLVRVATATPRRSRVIPVALLALALVHLATRGPWSWMAIGGGAFRSVRTGSEVDLDSYWARLAAHDDRVVFLEHGTLATVSLERAPSGELSLRVNGKVDASTTGDVNTQNLLAHLPLLLHPAPRDALVIGLGSGMTVGAALTHDLEQVDVCEIEPAVVRAARHFGPWNRQALDSPRASVHMEDARAFLLRTDRRYDVIISEPSNPWMAGIAELFTTGFYQKARRHLRPGGVYLQWFHLYETDVLTTSIIVRTLLEVFPHASLWALSSGDVALISGRDGPLAPDLSRLATRMADPRVAADMARARLPTPEALLGANLMGSASLAGWGQVPDAPRNTDDLPVLEYEAPRAFLEGGRVPMPGLAPDSLFLRLPAKARDLAARRQVARYHLAIRGDLPRAAAWLQDAVAADPGALDDHHQLARVLLAQGKPLAAAEHLALAASQAAEAARDLASLLLESGTETFGTHWFSLAEVAMASLESASASGAATQEQLAALGRLAQRAGVPARAARAHEALRTRFPDLGVGDSEAQYLTRQHSLREDAARALERAGVIPAARRLAAEAAAFEPEPAGP